MTDTILTSSDGICCSQTTTTSDIPPQAVLDRWEREMEARIEITIAENNRLRDQGLEDGE